MNILHRRRIDRGVWLLLIALLLAALLGVVIFLIWGRLSPVNSSVATSKGNIYFLLSAERVPEGGSVGLEVRISPETAIDTVMAEVSYNPDSLQYESTEYETSVFMTQIPAEDLGDSVRVTAAIMGGETVSSDSSIATVRFRALKDQQVEVGLSGGSALAGKAMNPRINGELSEEVRETQDGQSTSQRWIHSAAVSVGLVLVGGTVYLVVKKIRKGRKEHHASES